MVLEARRADAFDLSDSDDDDDVLAATQVASATASTNEAAAAVAPAVDARVHCAVCALDLSHWSIQDRAVHMNACLDAAAAPRECACPTCGKQLTDYNEQRRTAHVNLCLDRLLAAASGDHESSWTGDDALQQQQLALAAGDDEQSADSSRDPDAYSCVICGLDLTRKDFSARIRHVKQCGQRFGVRPSDVAALQPERQEGQLSATENDHAGTETGAGASDAAADAAMGDGSAATNAFAVMMRTSSASSSMLSGTIGGCCDRAVPFVYRAVVLIRCRLSSLGRVGQVVSNAFDVLMKSSKTQAVVAAATSNSNSGGGGAFQPSAQPSVQRFGKKRRVGGASSWSHSAAETDHPTRRRPCPDFKRIKGTQPSFIVDGFQYASKALSSVYFLTHFHSDHYTGLDKVL